MGLNLVILAAILTRQLIEKKARPDASRDGFFGLTVFIAAVILIFGNAGYLSWKQYQSWQSGDFEKLLLPPYQNFDYFIFYARARFFNSYLISLFIGILFLWAVKYFNKKYQERFFNQIEPYFLAISIFLTGHPMWLFYLMILLSAFLMVNFLLSAFHFLLRKEMPRISLYYFWLPAAISTILISKWLGMLSWWKMLKI